MKNLLPRMHSLLKAALAGAGVPDAQVGYDKAGAFFSLGQSGVEVAIERRDGRNWVWLVREIYDFADLEEGGHRPVGATVNVFKVGDEISAAKCAVMRVIEIRVDGGLDAVA